MRLSRQHWLTRWYLWSLTEERQRVRLAQGTTVCEMVAQVVGFTVFLAVLTCIIPLFVLYQAIVHWREVWPVAAVLALMAVLMTAAYGVQRGCGSLTRAYPTVALATAWLQAKKRRVCPLVTFEGD